LDLSVVVPAYNEEKRLSPMLDEALDYLKSCGLTWEIIVVDDGSRDATAALVMERYCQQYGTDAVRVLKLSRNRGKGGAVRRGMMQARGRALLMADADGATKFSDLRKLIGELKSLQSSHRGHGIVVGSRAHKQDEAVARRSFFRNILMWGFHLAVQLVGVRGVKDTQCGFKLFSRESARLLFPFQHVERWAFDVELLLIAQSLGIPITEVAVNWEEIDGSKLDPLSATLEMLRDMTRIRLAYTIGIWRLRSKPIKSN
jgi:dolichyl-phosphate beta-glucosyltransferase